MKLSAVRLLRTILGWVVALVAHDARAHDPGISTAQGEVRGGVLSFVTGFAPADAQQFLPEALRKEGTWTQADFEAVQDRLLAVAPQLWEVRAGEKSLPPRDLRVELLPGDNVSFHVVFSGFAPGDKLTLRAPKLAELPAGHRQFVIVSDERGLAIAKKLLSGREAFVEISPAEWQAASPAATSAAEAPAQAQLVWGFIKLGVEHIWTGYDHLLFLFALLVVCRSFRSIVGIITCFTLAHSLTLALATFDVVNLPARWVEAAIAASIVFVGVENLLRRGEEPRGRWALTFAFGLVHGFGFASVLRDLGVGSGGQGIAMPLFTFNLGVELGQIAIAAVVLPIVWRLRKNSGFVRRGVPALSALVALAGLFWLVQRTLA